MDNQILKIAQLAKNNSMGETAELFGATFEAIRTNQTKNYAVLGNVNSGKSTLINLVTDAKSAPVSIVSNCHDSVLRIADFENGRCFVEMQNDIYCNLDADCPEHPLWGMDGAVYILSAVAPLSIEDVNAIKCCVSHGVPCIPALGKLDLIHEEEREDLLTSVRIQLTHLFGSDEMILLNRDQPQETKDLLDKALASFEDNRDTRRYLLTVAFAKRVQDEIAKEFSACKVATDNELQNKKAQSAKREKEKILWESIETQMMNQEVKLVRDLQMKVYNLFGKASESLCADCKKASSLKKWWETQMEVQMREQNEDISKQISQIIADGLSADRNWLIHEVEEKFGIDLALPEESVSVKLLAENHTAFIEKNPSKSKYAALSGLGISASLLLSAWLMPIPLATAITLATITGATTLGTGFWAYLASKQDKETQQKILIEEIIKYVSESRDAAISNLNKQIHIVYENLLIALKDKQLMTKMDSNNTDLDKKLSDKMAKLHADSEQIQSILNTLLFS